MKTEKFCIDISKIDFQYFDKVEFKNYMKDKGYSITCEINYVDKLIKIDGKSTRHLTPEMVIEILEKSKDIVVSIDTVVEHLIEFYIIMNYVVKKLKYKKIDNKKAELDNEK